MNLVKVLALSLVLAVVGGTLTGCGKSDSLGMTSTQKEEEKRSIEAARRATEARRLH
ncbi:MAG: hypothetical protein AB1768_18690 [Pseudomonadota bacterium]